MRFVAKDNLLDSENVMKKYIIIGSSIFIFFFMSIFVKSQCASTITISKSTILRIKDRNIKVALELDDNSISIVTSERGTCLFFQSIEYEPYNRSSITSFIDQENTYHTISDLNADGIPDHKLSTDAKGNVKQFLFIDGKFHDCSLSGSTYLVDNKVVKFREGSFQFLSE